MTKEPKVKKTAAPRKSRAKKPVKVAGLVYKTPGVSAGTRALLLGTSSHALVAFMIHRNSPAHGELYRQRVIRQMQSFIRPERVTTIARP